MSFLLPIYSVMSFGISMIQRSDKNSKTLLPHLDYISPMLYPSGFQYGIPGYRNPVAYPYEIVYLTLKKGPETHRSSILSVSDHGYRHSEIMHLTEDTLEVKEIRGEIKAAEDFGSHGWMLWNPKETIISSAGREKEKPLG